MKLSDVCIADLRLSADELNELIYETNKSYIVFDEDPERDKLIASMKSDHEGVVEIIKAAVKEYREERDWCLRSDSCQKYIQKEYLKYLDVIETPIYYDSAPVELFDTLERLFRKRG